MKPLSTYSRSQAFTLTKALQHRTLSEAEEIGLAARISAGDRGAVDELTVCNARLAYKWARGFTMGGRVCVDDLFHEAWLGVRRAAERYVDGTLRFNKFSKWPIKERVLLFAYGWAFGPAEVPSRMMRIHRAVWGARGELNEELGREPDAVEVAVRAGVSLTHARQFLLLGMETVSLNEPVSADTPEVGSLIDSLADDSEYVWHGTQLAAADLSEFLSVLNDRQASVIRMRFGLVDGECLPNVEIARRLGLSREAVRQIGDRAMMRLAGRKGWLEARAASRRCA